MRFNYLGAVNKTSANIETVCSALSPNVEGNSERINSAETVADCLKIGSADRANKIRDSLPTRPSEAAHLSNLQYITGETLSHSERFPSSDKANNKVGEPSRSDQNSTVFLILIIRVFAFVRILQDCKETQCGISLDNGVVSFSVKKQIFNENLDNVALDIEPLLSFSLEMRPKSVSHWNRVKKHLLLFIRESYIHAISLCAAHRVGVACCPPERVPGST